jgi:general secretion pathway protein D/MSHA biogenesis protein MshL
VKVKTIIFIMAMALLASGCATTQRKVSQTTPVKSPTVTQQMKLRESHQKQMSRASTPVTMTKNKYKLKPLELEITGGKPYMPVGAEIISKAGKVPLFKVIKKLADLKGYSVSWADDVDLNLKVDVHIRPEDNFWQALDNILRQVDYFYELDKETLVIKYKETVQYHLVMPNLKQDFKTSVGGNIIGTAGAEGQITGETSMSADIAEPLEFWKIVEDNLNKIITETEQEQTTQEEASTTTTSKGYFVIDRHLGLITVTAPRKTHARIRSYIKNLKKVMYRQVVIEAKIVEVELTKSSEYGIDWSNLLQSHFNITPRTNIYPRNGVKLIQSITLGPAAGGAFDILVSALKQYGDVKVLSNPKITLMNGQGASITVGDNRTYVDKVESTTDDAGNVTYTVTTASVLSGIGLAVMANIINDNEVILYIVPVTTELQSYSSTEPIEYRTFGTAQVGLPRIKLRELATMAKVKSGETLIIGGQISTRKTDTTKSVPLLGDIPILGWLFKHKAQSLTKTELVIFLQPKIIPSTSAKES